MSAGGTPIDPNEPVLRRIAIAAGYYESSEVPPVRAGAFRPNDKDVDGLSFYLEREVSAPCLAAASSKPASSYVVARFRAGDLFALNLSLVPTPGIGDLPGHLSMPEITRDTYKDPVTGPRVKELGKALADLACRDIAYPPPS
jgi:hypothetical protein